MPICNVCVESDTLGSEDIESTPKAFTGIDIGSLVLTFEDADDSNVVVQKPINKMLRNSRNLWLSNDKKRAKSDAGLGDVKNRGVSITSFCSLDMGALDITRLYFDACKQNDIAAIETLLVRDSSLANEKDANGWSGLHFAAKNSCKPIVKLLYSYGADVNFANENGDTPLHVAVESGDEEIVAFLISLDASATVVNEKGIFPLLKAILLNKLDVVVALLSNLSNINVNQVDKSNYSALHWAAQLDHSECASILLKYGCNIGALCNLKYTALHWAAKCSASRTLEAMLQY
uniref:Uncharacterized protein n=1 Tax=Romanomermis culicivorax TaxID=13658 RepID=A0A915J7J3_ROMCU